MARFNQARAAECNLRANLSRVERVVVDQWAALGSPGLDDAIFTTVIEAMAANAKLEPWHVVRVIHQAAIVESMKSMEEA
jgi:hypothetical protein